MKKIVSILMGIYNCADTLPEAIDSILSQTYPDWELILCDDGSSDRTYAVAEGYRQRYPRKIILLKNDRNMGLNHTLNRCLDHASGEYIARMDGDDISLPTRLEAEVQFLDENPDYAIVSTPMIYFDEHGEWGVGTAKADPTNRDFISGPPFCHAPCMVRREAFAAVGGYTEEKKLLRVEDYDLWVRMYAAGYRGMNLAESLYAMRDDRSAYSRRKFKYRINEFHVRLKAAKLLHLGLKAYVYALRPIAVGLLPESVYRSLHKKRLEKNT